jgi:hypothetical protein
VAFGGLFRFGGDLLSRVLGRSTIGAAALNGRVRDGIGCFARAVATKPGKRTGGVPLWDGAARRTRDLSFQTLSEVGVGFLSGVGGPTCFRIGSKPIGRLVPVS